jgi:hypothetical protein
VLKVSEDEFFLAGEVLVNGGITQVRRSGDLLHDCAIEALFGHQIYRRTNDEALIFGLLRFGGSRIEFLLSFDLKTTVF